MQRRIISPAFLQYGTFEGEKTESLKNKWDAYKEEQAGAYKEKQKKRLEEKLTEKRTNKRTAQQTEKKETSPTGIKKGVPLNSNLC